MRLGDSKDSWGLVRVTGIGDRVGRERGRVEGKEEWENFHYSPPLWSGRCQAVPLPPPSLSP